jgi:hypothetical protein
MIYTQKGEPHVEMNMILSIETLYLNTMKIILLKLMLVEKQFTALNILSIAFKRVDYVETPQMIHLKCCNAKMYKCT